MLRLHRIKATLFAGAVGDAVGAHAEGRPKGAAQLPLAWTVTDDTQLTLATCEAMVAERRVSAESIARSFAGLWRSGELTGAGASTVKALRDLAAGQHWALSGASGDRTGGNGAAMRIAPVAIALDAWEASNRLVLRDVVRITHRHEESWAGALALALALRSLRATHEAHIEHRVALTDIAAALPDSHVRDNLHQLAALSEGQDLSRAAEITGTSGYAAESVPLALFAGCMTWRSLGDAVLEMVALGGDTDTNASMTAQLLAQRGLDPPSLWCTQLECAPRICALSESLAGDDA